MHDHFNAIFIDQVARHKEPSVISSLDDATGKPTRRLIELTLAAVNATIDLELHTFSKRTSTEAAWFETWPGEHYRLLAGLVQTLKPMRVVEIGTFTGMGTVSLAQELPPGGTVTTFDLLGWDTFQDTWLNSSDFESGKIVQHLHDLSAPSGMAPFKGTLESADLIFIDGPKDGKTEAALLKNMADLQLKNDALVVFDDIRVMNMVNVWREICHPKLDVTSFGHWSGTGLIDWGK